MSNDRTRWPLLGWAATRAMLLTALFGLWRFPGTDVTPDVSRIYQGWYHQLLSGTFPIHDVTWQYPPIAAAAMLAPGLLPFLPYAQAFFVLAAVADAVVMGLLLRAARRGDRRMAGPWLWVVGIAVLGPTCLARYDVMVTAVAVAALVAAARRPRLAGVLAGIGALFKVWPVLALAGLRRGRPTRRAWWWGALTAAAVSAVFLVFTRGAFAFLTEQRERGTEIESLGALPFHLARYAGVWHGTARLHYGSFEFLGPYVHTASDVMLAVTALAFGWLLWWRIRAVAFTDTVVYDAAFAAVLVFITTSRVISPQYLIWLLGLGGLCLTRQDTVQRRPIVLTLMACAFTVLEFPIGFGTVVRSELPGIVVLLVRNGLLVTAAVWACRGLWRSTAAASRPGVSGRAPAQQPALSA